MTPKHREILDIRFNPRKGYRSHSEVIDLLEHMLELAKENSFASCVVSMIGHWPTGTLAAFDCAGEIGLQDSQHDALQLISERLQKSIDKWTFPPQDETLDASYVRYNLIRDPLGHDFLYWMLNAEMTRIREGAPAPLKVAFFQGTDPAVMMKDSRLHWLNTLFRPALEFIGAVEDNLAMHGRQERLFVPRTAIEFCKAGEKVPLFKAPATTAAFVSTLPKDYVTITLREVNRDHQRNSNMAEWLAFGDYLRKNGQHVIFVRDTENAYAKLGDFDICPVASTSVHSRMALYENAKANLFTSNGPAILAIHSDKPWLVFIRLQQEAYVDSDFFWENTIGLPVGSQYPWSADNQRVVWKDDTFSNIVAAWEEHIVPALSLAA